MALDISFLFSEHTLIPFMFVLAIIFGVLELVKIFRNRAVNFLIALSISFFTITNTAFVELLWTYFGSITSFFILMFMIAFVFEIFGLRGGRKENSSTMIINGAILFLLLSLGFYYAGLVPVVPFIGGGQNLILVVLLIFILVLFWSAFKMGAGGK
jgi:hypothetical protein